MLTSCPPKHDATMGNCLSCQSHKGPCCQHKSLCTRSLQPQDLVFQEEASQATGANTGSGNRQKLVRSVFTQEETGCKAWGCQAKQTLTSNLLLHAPNTLAQPRGERRGTKFPSFPQPQSNSEASAAEASQDSPASGQVRCQTGCCWKNGQERKQTLIC